MKDCYPQWANCPSTKGDKCMKVRICTDEKVCFVEWRRLSSK